MSRITRKGLEHMREISFSVPVSGVIRINGNIVTVIVNRATTRVLLEGDESPQRTVFEPGTNMFNILLESAQEFLRRKAYNRFTGPDLFAIAREKYPDLKNHSFMSRLTAATPNHPSYKYHLSKRDYFSRIALGIYTLENKYRPQKATQTNDTLGAELSQKEIS